MLALLWSPPYNSHCHAVCQSNFNLVLIPPVFVRVYDFFLLTGGECWSCCRVFSLGRMSSYVICKSGSNGSITAGDVLVYLQLFSRWGEPGWWERNCYLRQRGRNTQLCYCPGSRRPFDWILRKIRSECLHSGQLAQGSVPPAWHGSWLVLVCSGSYNKIPQAG